MENRNFLLQHLSGGAFLTLFVGISLSVWLLLVKPRVDLLKVLTYTLNGISELQSPLMHVCLGCVISKLRHGEEFKKHLMINSKIALVLAAYQTHSLFKLVVIPAAVLAAGHLANKCFLQSATFEAVLGKYFLSSLWPSPLLLLLPAVLEKFAFREVAYLLYYDLLLSAMTMPLMTWLFYY